MEVIKLDIIGSYSYKPDIELASYNKDEVYTKECIICKMSLFEPSYEMICDNKNLVNKCEIVIGKCGHMFHGDCLNKWLKTCDFCPIDKVKWCLHKIADTTTNLVTYECDKNYNNFVKNKFNRNIFNTKKKYYNKK